jgi:hypothetical protein
MHKASFLLALPLFAVACEHEGERLFDRSGRTGAELTADLGADAGAEIVVHEVERVACEGETLEGSFETQLEAQVGAATFVSLEAGCFAITATALDAARQPIEGCSPVTTVVDVALGLVTSVHLLPTCGSDGDGGIDPGELGGNTCPDVTSVVQVPDIELGCQELLVCVSAVDADGDAMVASWTALAGELPCDALVVSSSLTVLASGAMQLDECVVVTAGLAGALTGALTVHASVTDTVAQAEIGASIDLETCADLGLDL